jgi:hypothetical protein
VSKVSPVHLKFKFQRLKKFFIGPQTYIFMVCPIYKFKFWVYYCLCGVYLPKPAGLDPPNFAGIPQIGCKTKKIEKQIFTENFLKIIFRKLFLEVLEIFLEIFF